jgi:PAS domain S-box-containing protein
MLGAVGLSGNIVGSSALTTFVPGQPAMMPNTAFGLLLIGGAGALCQREEGGRLRRALSVMAALVVLAMGIGTLAEYAFDINLHIDQLLLEMQAEPHPGRPSPPTALALTLLSAGLLLFNVRPTAHVRPSEWLILSGGLVALTAFLGLVFGADPLYRMTLAPVKGVAVPTALSLLLTSAGLLLARPAGGFMRLATSPGPGGVLLRHLVTPSILAPLLLGLVVLRSASALGIGDLAVIVATFASLLTVFGLLVLTFVAVPLNHAHEALQSARSRTKELIEQAPDGIFVADLQGHYTDVNAAGCRMCGYSRDEILGKTIVDLIPPEDVPRLERVKQRLLEGKIDFSEWTIRAKDGRDISVEVSTKILQDGRWQGFVRDITERKQLQRQAESAREQLGESEERFRLAIDEAPIGMALVALDGRLMRVNRALCEIVGYRADELTDLTFQAITHPDDLHAGLALEGQLYRGTIPRYQKETRYVRKDGQIVDARLSGSIVRGRAGEPLYYIAQVEDITEQKRIEQEQKFLAELGPVLATTLDYEETLSRLTQIAVRDLADLCIIDLVDDDGELRRHRVVSRDKTQASLCEMLQRMPPDRPQFDFVRSALETTRAVLMPRPLTEPIAEAFDAAPHAPLGVIALHSGMAFPLEAHGKVPGVLTLLSSTPARVYGQEDMRVGQELAQRAALAIENARLYRSAQNAIQMRDEVLGIVVHDLRNPLATIVLEAGLLLRARMPEPERRAADAIHRAASRMKRLIQDLLDVTRIEAGRLAIELDGLSAAEVVAGAVEMQRPLASSSSLELDLQLEPDLPTVWADRDRLFQVLENLIGNAIKFSEPGGRIVIGAAPLDDDVLFWVRDTGAGIAAENLSRVFDRFWQTREARHGGAGLGLPIVKGIIEAHRGRVWVESTLGHGSTFFFTLPTTGRAERLDSARRRGPIHDVAR